MPKAMQYTSGSVIYFEGAESDRIFILQRGTVVLTSIDIETGREIAEQVHEGEFFSVKSALGHFPHEETARVLTDSAVVMMTVPEFEKMFSTNKGLILKMLKVFSNQLRGIHHKIASILHSVEGSIDEGMLDVVKAFFNDEEYLTTFDLCQHYLKKYPNTPNKMDIAKTMAESKRKYEIQSKRAAKKPRVVIASEDSSGEDAALKQFALPAFSRFAKQFKPGEVIIAEFEPGDCFYLIQSGHVQLVKTVNGSNKNLDLLGPSQFFGEMAILENTPRSATCIAADDVEVLEFNKANFELLIAGNPQIALILLKMFCKRIYDQKRRLRILVISDKQARVGDVFLMLEDTQPQNQMHSGDKVRFNLTAQDVAHWAGLPLNATNDELSRYVGAHKIEMYDDYIIVNIGEMQRIVEQRKAIRGGV